MAADEPLITDEEAIQIRADVTEFYHGIDETPRLLEFARRIEALVRQRLAERLRAQFDHSPDDDCGPACVTRFNQGQCDANIVEGAGD